jgi:anti-sigma B factor antagonist
MNVETALYHGGVAVVRLAGQIDPQIAVAIKQRLAGLIASGHPCLIVDLAGVTFVNSASLRVLIEGCKAARLAGGDMRLARLTEQARAVLRLTLLDQFIQAYATTEAAQASFDADPAR